MKWREGIIGDRGSLSSLRCVSFVEILERSCTVAIENRGVFDNEKTRDVRYATCIALSAGG